MTQPDPPAGYGWVVPAPPGDIPPPIFYLAEERKQPSRGWAIAFCIIIGLWVVGWVTVPHALGWLVADGLVALGVTLPAWVWPALGGITALLAMFPAALLGGLSKVDFTRAAGRAWALAALLGGLLGGLRLIPVAYQEFYLAALAVAAAL